MYRYKLSIVIPTYNRYDFLVRAVQSVQYHEHDYEVVIVNDGAEFTAAQANELASIHQHTQLINSGSKSVAKARNQGILAAQGEWLVFLDDDDIFHEQYLFKLGDEIVLRPEVDFFWCSVEIKTMDKRRGTEEISYRRYSSSYSTELELYKNALSIGSSFGLAIRRYGLKVTELFDPAFSVGEDTEFVMRMLDQGCVPGPIDFVGVTKMEQHDDRLSSSFAVYSHNDIYERIFAKNIGFLLKYPPLYRLLLVWASRVHLESGEALKAIRCIYKIFLLGYYWSFLGEARYFLMFVARAKIKALSGSVVAR